MKKLRRVLLLVSFLFSVSALYGAVAQYDFNSTLNPSASGAALSAGFAAPAASASVSYSTLTINGAPAQVASFSRGTWFSMTHGLGANGGGSLLNQYTLIFDVMFPSRPSGWAVLYQNT